MKSIREVFAEKMELKERIEHLEGELQEMTERHFSYVNRPREEAEAQTDEIRILDAEVEEKEVQTEAIKFEDRAKIAAN